MRFLILVEDLGIYQADNQDIFFSDCCGASEDLSNSIQFEPLKVLDFLMGKKLSFMEMRCSPVSSFLLCAVNYTLLSPPPPSNL